MTYYSRLRRSDETMSKGKGDGSREGQSEKFGARHVEKGAEVELKYSTIDRSVFIRFLNTCAILLEVTRRSGRFIQLEDIERTDRSSLLLDTVLV